MANLLSILEGRMSEARGKLTSLEEAEASAVKRSRAAAERKSAFLPKASSTGRGKKSTNEFPNPEAGKKGKAAPRGVSKERKDFTRLLKNISEILEAEKNHKKKKQKRIIRTREREGGNACGQNFEGKGVHHDFSLFHLKQGKKA